MSGKKKDVAVVASRELKRTLKDREEQKFMMRARLAKRDLDYAESPYAARVVVGCVRTTDGRTLVVETRGQRCIGSRCGMFIQPDTRRW